MVFRLLTPSLELVGISHDFVQRILLVHLLRPARGLPGHDIVEFEQGGKTRAAYGKALLSSLSRDLSLRHGRGFSRSNVTRFRQFYLAYPKGAKASHILGWSHYVELLKLEDELERSFYEQQAIREKWSVPELQRQKNTPLFHRLAADKDKDAILQLAVHGPATPCPFKSKTSSTSRRESTFVADNSVLEQRGSSGVGRKHAADEQAHKPIDIASSIVYT